MPPTRPTRAKRRSTSSSSATGRSAPSRLPSWASTPASRTTWSRALTEPLFPLLPGRAPAAFLALVVAEAAFHARALDAAAELAAHAGGVDVGEGDLRAAQPRLAQPAVDRAEHDRAVDLLEGLLDRHLGL